MKLLILSGVLLALAAPAAAQQATAGADPEARQTTVSYRDLNLTRAAGADIMIGRLRQAASVVCGSPPLPQELRAYRAYRACKRQAVETALAKVDAPLVTARFHRSHPDTLMLARK